MGKYLKNRELPTASYSTRLPIGSSAVGPDAPVDGLIRYNIDTRKLELYSERAWQSMKVVSGLIREISKDTFYGDGSTRIFGPMRYSYYPGDEIRIFVYVGNVFQNPGIAYTIDDDRIEFSSAPPIGHTIIIIHGFSG